VGGLVSIIDLLEFSSEDAVEADDLTLLGTQIEFLVHQLSPGYF
jgi:hypothetical protein